ncbi:hypothetical protein BXP70_11620 [Hymenobacter crusticola]|uniref:Glycosyltransferase RgtA/B/C/D-like domain-containing protein n=1 Tax=Hymenobacter crusticola TaxID=1770526 RepID=A0A243WD87_9BACT|nr:hypothetical protein BXP70_11620 [Hymenobacter crusticola]
MVLGVRLSFVGHGAMAFPDEERYYQSVEAIKSFSKGDLRAVGAHLVQTQGRPGDALLRLLPAAMQGIWYTVGGPGPHNPTSLLIPVLFTYGVSVLSLLLFYRLARMLLPTQVAALLSTLLYACLVNSNVYIRHILPYELGLCSFLGLLVWLVRAQQQGRILTLKQTWALGVGAAFTVAIYPGYFFAPIILLAVMVSPLLKEPISALSATHHKFPSFKVVVCFFGIGALSMLAILEVLALLTGVSYLQACQELLSVQASTITQGDFQESFSFLFKYLFEVEGALGVLLLMLVGYGLASRLYKMVRRRKRVPKVELSSSNALYLAVLAAFLAYAALGFWGHKLVFYGRVLHFFLPFIVLFAVASACSWKSMALRVRPLVAAFLIGVALYSFGRFALQYREVVYPLDLLASPALRLVQQNTLFRNQMNASDNDDYYIARQNLAHTEGAQGEAILLNFSFLYPIVGPGCNEVRIPAGFHQVFAAPHFLTIPAYGFEGFLPKERALLQQCQYQCKVFVRQ